MRKRISMIAMMFWMTLAMGISASAGQWKQDTTGWWWQENDGSYPISEWRWIDGNNDGEAECYYFGSDGYLLTDTRTPDGYMVDHNGAWVENGIVRTKTAVSGPVTGMDIKAPAALPAFNAPVTQDNILALLDNLDPDGACIIRNALVSPMNAANPLLGWWNGASRITDQLQTAVHEEAHVAAGSEGYGRQRIYIGDGQYVTVEYTPVFDSIEISAGIPLQLRTFRFNTYLGIYAMPNLSSRCDGVYGMLDEYAAYCWGTNAEWKTYSYCLANGRTNWSNSWLAYAEFRYYILRYILYAGEHYPEIYQGILGNYNFKKAFTAIDGQFASIIRGYHEILPEYAVSFSWGEYSALMNEMSRPEYQELISLLRP